MKLVVLVSILAVYWLSSGPAQAQSDALMEAYPESAGSREGEFHPVAEGAGGELQRLEEDGVAADAGREGR